MNHNLVYGDDEVGGQEATTLFSTEGKAGMGDYYVVDLFQPSFGAGESDTLYFRPQATLYWHER